MRNNTKFFGELILSPGHRISGHLLLIVCIALLTFWEMKDVYTQSTVWLPVVVSSATCLLAVYLNIYILVPKLLLKRWHGVYLLVVVYIIILAYFAEHFLIDKAAPAYNPKIRELYGKVEISPVLQIFASASSLGILILSSSAVVLFRRWMVYDVHYQELEKSAIAKELEQLKKQVNPRFLGLMLDKAVQLSVRNKQAEASSVLLQLGNMLRYQLYDSTRDLVLLSADIQFLATFLELEKIRRNDFSFHIERDDSMVNCLVPPLLFMSITEYVLSNDPLNIRLFFRREGESLIFECRSSPVLPEKDDGGLQDIRRRLGLLFVHYALDTGNKDGEYLIRLQLDLRLITSAAS